MPNNTPIRTDAGLQFGPTASGKLYLSIAYHRGAGSARKARWDDGFIETEEFQLFEQGDAHGWFCREGNLWGIVDDGKRKLGKEGERISFCPRTRNPQDAWHGYPVCSSSKEIPEDVVARWSAAGVIGGVTAKRIRGGKL